MSVGSIDVLRSLATAQAESGDTDAAVEMYKRAIAGAVKVEAVLELAQARRDLGLLYLKRKQMTEAIQVWLEALSIYEERNAHAQIARLQCDIGNARRAIGQFQRSLRDYEQALMTLNLVDENDLETRGLVLSNAANIYAEQGDVESADAFFNESVALADKLGDRAAEATRLGNYGWFSLLVGRPRRAMSALERALKLSQELRLPLQSAVQTDNIGLVHDVLGEYELALDQHRRALALLGEGGSRYWRASFLINQAHTLTMLRRPDEAQPLLDEALKIGRAEDNSELVIRAQTGIGEVALLRDDPNAADTPLNEAIALARRIEARRLLALALSARSQQLAALERIADANAAWEEAQRWFTMLHMPQGKTSPAWLRRAAT
ncbi:MAG: tetratricopeptide repeat protein [Blastochloris sp.]|nr:tetratricopeptide repeat protein [Blastochloris sp.]